jgi:hypothetical protein
MYLVHVINSTNLKNKIKYINYSINLKNLLCLKDNIPFRPNALLREGQLVHSVHGIGC